MQSRVLGWSRSTKRLVVVALDVVLALLSTWIAFTLRLDTPNWPTGAQWWVYTLSPVLSEPCPMRCEPEQRPVFPSRNEPEAVILGELVSGLIIPRW